MDRYRRIHVGLELDLKEDQITAGSLKAAEQAVWLAGRTGASVHLLHSTWNDEFGEARELSAEHRATLEDLAADVHEQGVEASLTIVEERAWLGITRRVSRHEPELVLVAKRDRVRDEGRRIGNVAIKLIRKCPATVWVVRPEHDLVHKLVLGATDRSAVGAKAAAHAAWIARESEDCELHLLHAYRVPETIPRDELSDDEYKEAVEAYKSDLQHEIQRSLADGSPESTVHLSRGVPAQEVREAVQHLKPDLLVLGSLSRGGVAGIQVGATAERLLQRVDCSLLCVKPADFVCPVPG